MNFVLANVWRRKAENYWKAAMARISPRVSGKSEWRAG